MKKKRFSVEQITSVLQQVASGVPVGDECRQVGVSEQTFYRWKKTYGGMLPSEARELKQLREENARLKRVVADLTLDKGRSNGTTTSTGIYPARGSASLSRRLERR